MSLRSWVRVGCLAALGTLAATVTSSCGNAPTAVISYVISGTVSGVSTTPVVMTLGGANGATTATNPYGYYSFTVEDGSYTITPTLSGYTFSPSSIPVTVNGANVSGENFISTALPPNVVFVTSVTGTGNLGSWSDAGGQTGLAAADAICQARATAAKLPGTFRAWLSDGSNDAYCRVHGLAGKKSANCGQSQLPASAGPWVRVDGFPFSSGITQLVTGVEYTPLYYDETKTPVPQYTYSFTDTIAGVLDAQLNPTPCSNWTAATTGSPLVDKGGATSPAKWNWGVEDACSSTGNLICFQQGSGGPLPSFVSSGKLVFVTSETGSGALGTWAGASGLTGLAAGDAICQARATAAGLSGTFTAWLSASGINAVDRLTATGPWVRVDGIPVATSKADLTDGAIFTAIMLTETGAYSYSAAWTGTQDSGLGTGANCVGWTSQAATDSGTWGNVVFVMGWSSVGTSQACNGVGAIYCFEN